MSHSSVSGSEKSLDFPSSPKNGGSDLPNKLPEPSTTNPSNSISNNKSSQSGSSSRTFPKLELSGNGLKCPKEGHSGKLCEFVCTKRECRERLTCSYCLLTEHSEHFQWMVGVDEFFNPKPVVKASSEKGGDEKFSMVDFVQDKDELIKKFEEKLSGENAKVMMDLTNFRNKFMEKINILENMIPQNVDQYKKSFQEDIQTIQDYTSSVEKITFPENIENVDMLREYLNYHVTKENDLKENKFERVFENLKDKLNALSLMDFDSQKSQDILSTLNNLIDFSLKLDYFEFHRKATAIPTSTVDCTKLVCKRTIQTTHKKPIYKVIFLEEENKIVTCSDDYTIMVYDFITGNPLHTLTGHSDRIWNLIKLKNGLLASCSSDTSIRVWNVEKLCCERVLQGHSGLVCCLMEMPNLLLLSGSQDKSLKVWDLKSESKECARTVKNSSMGRIMTCILINKDEIACGSEANIQVINFFDGTLKRTLTGHASLVRDLNLLADGNTLLSGSDDKSIRMWNLAEGKCLKIFNGHTHSANKILLWSPTVIVSASDDHSIKFWNLEDGKCVKTLTGHAGWVIFITIRPDGTLISCGADKTIKVWDSS